MASFFKNKTVNLVWMVILFSVPFVLWYLPGDFFDNGTIELCPSKAFFDYECFGCGITRAVQHAHNFEFADAMYYNKLVVAVYPFLIYLWFSWMKAAAGYGGLLKKK